MGTFEFEAGALFEVVSMGSPEMEHANLLSGPLPPKTTAFSAEDSPF